MTLYKLAKLVGGEDLIKLHYPNGKTETTEGCILLHAVTYENPDYLTLEVGSMDRYLNDYGHAVIEVELEYGSHYTKGLADVLGDDGKPDIDEAMFLMGSDRYAIREDMTLGFIDHVADMSGRPPIEVFMHIYGEGFPSEQTEPDNREHPMDWRGFTLAEKATVEYWLDLVDATASWVDGDSIGVEGGRRYIVDFDDGDSETYLTEKDLVDGAKLVIREWDKDLGENHYQNELDEHLRKLGLKA